MKTIPLVLNNGFDWTQFSEPDVEALRASLRKRVSQVGLATIPGAALPYTLIDAQGGCWCAEAEVKNLPVRPWDWPRIKDCLEKQGASKNAISQFQNHVQQDDAWISIISVKRIASGDCEKVKHA